MSISFNIDLEKLQSLNGVRAEAFFKYLKRVSKNNTPIVLTGTKKANYWDCCIVECSIPTSIFSSIKLPADNDKNAEGQKLTVQLTTELINEFVDGTEFTVKESTINITRNGFKAKSGRTSSSEALEEQLAEFMSMLKVDDIPNNAKLSIQASSEIVSILKNMKASPDAAIFVNSKSITLMDDTVFFRTKLTEGFEASEDYDIYLNMYLSNMITGFLDYSDLVTLEVKNNKMVVTGYEGTEENSENVIVKNISAVYETEASNPTDEDLAGNYPNESEATVISLDLDTFIETLESQKSSISAFSEFKNWQAKLLKNGEGLILGFAGKDDPDKILVTVSVGDVESTEVDTEDFTSFATIFPLDLISSVFQNSLKIEIIYQDDEDTAVLFRVGESNILSGKIF